MFESLDKNDLVLVTGGTGTLGTALLPRLLERGCTVRVLSRDECKQGELAHQYPHVEWRLGDVRDPTACRNAVRNATVVIHAASLKYVDLSEKQPSEYALTNTLGTMNMIDAILHERGVRVAVGISSDKACLPINAYGMTKALLEKMFVEAHATRRGNIPTRFVVCRYGNVIGSRGSVVLKWQEAVRKGERIKVTNPDMTRFFFTIQDAINLIDYALTAEGGCILAAEMPSTTIGELACLWGDYDVIGSRPGEKFHESLISVYESAKTELHRPIFIYTPLGADNKLFHPPYSLGYTSESAPHLDTALLKTLTAEWRPQCSASA